jgi:hypothetical protein
MEGASYHKQHRLEYKITPDDDDDDDDKLNSGVIKQQWVTGSTNIVPLSGWLSFVNKLSRWNAPCWVALINPNRKPNFLLTTPKTDTPTWPFPGPNGVNKFRPRWFQVEGWSEIKFWNFRRNYGKVGREEKKGLTPVCLPVIDGGLANKG